MGRNQYLIIGGIIFLIVSIGIIFLLNKRIDTTDTTDPLKFIPNNTAIIVKINHASIINDIATDKYAFIQHIFKINMLAQFKNKLAKINNALQNNEAINKSFEKSETYLLLKPRPSGNIMWILGVENRDNIGINSITNFITNIWDTTGSYKRTDRKYEGNSIYQYKKADNADLFVTSVKGYTLISNSSIYIEDALRQNKLPQNIRGNKEFYNIFKTAGKTKPANFYINLSESPDLYSTLASDAVKDANILSMFQNTWCELDLNLKQDQMLLNGFVSKNDSLKNIFSLTEYIEPIKITSDKILPASIGSFFVFGNNDIKQFYTNYRNYLKLSGNSSLADYDATLKHKLGFSLSNRFLQIIDNEIGKAYQNYGSAKDDAYFVFIKTIGNDRAQKLLDDIYAAYSVDIKEKSYKYNVDNQVDYTIYLLPEANFCTKVFGPAFNGINDTYVVIYNNYMIFSNSYKNLTNFIYQGVLNKTLTTDPQYINYKNNISAKSYFIFYNNLSRNNLIVNKALNGQYISSWEDNLPTFQQIASVGFQISEVSDIPYCNFSWLHSKQEYSKPQTIWESLLDTTVNFKPQFVENHYTQEKEIFVQDDLNQIYLLNKAGRILWKQPINEKINSEVYQVDYYKNKKLQYLFSTKNYIHLVDRNGNYVERYPVKLRSAATTGMALFDYEKNRDYRILIPTENKKVYMYAIDGTQIKGWQFKGSEHIVNTTPQHFRIYNKDYIIFGDKYRHYILNRQGNVRVDPQKHYPKSVKTNYYLQDAGSLAESYFVTSDTSGNIIKMYINTNVEQLDIENNQINQQHQYIFHDLNADGWVDYLLLNNGILTTYNNKGEKLFSYKADKEFVKYPVIYYFSYKDRKIGLLTKNPSKIYLVNNDGQLYKGFPLEGNTLFSIGYFDYTSNNFNLIVGGRNNFLYNYNVE